MTYLGDLAHSLFGPDRPAPLRRPTTDGTGARSVVGRGGGVIGGIQCKLHYFSLALAHSDAVFIEA